jgi:hypothetical protein
VTGGQSVQAPADPAADGRAGWWAAGAIAALVGAVLGAQIATTLMAPVGIGLAMAVSFVRAGLLAPEVRRVATADDGTLMLRVGILGTRTFEPVWSRTQAVLRIGGGTTALSELDGTPVLSAPSANISFRAGSGWGKSGIWMEARAALDGGSGPSAPSGATDPPGWHPDPGGEARLRWWDGTRWTDHTA